MRPVAVVAAGAISALGEGDPGASIGDPAVPVITRVAHDEPFARAGLLRPRAARVPVALAPDADRAHALLRRAAALLRRDLEVALPDLGARRVAVLVGTSGAGMPSLERALSLRARGEPIPTALARSAGYRLPPSTFEDLFDDRWQVIQLLVACVSSTLAIGLGVRLLGLGEADLVIAGGYDALSCFIATGFEALGATTATCPRPFRRDRDGMALGEGAALLALSRLGEAPARLGCVLGFGASSDALHVTAPDPSGAGLERAARAALDDAGLDTAAVDWVSAHATATRHNDAAEAAALTALFGGRDVPVAVHPFKATIGHTLGAAGALESLAALGAIRAGVVPGAPGHGDLDASFPGRLLAATERAASKVCLKLSSAFGGMNAALVLGAAPPATTASGPSAGAGADGTPGDAPSAPAAIVARSVRPLTAWLAVSEPDLGLLTRRTRLEPVRIERLDRVSALAVTAVARLLDSLGKVDPARTAVVVGTVLGSLEANERFDRRRRDRGAAGVEPRRFPETSPNLPAGLCSIAFGLLGPSLAVGGGSRAPEEAERLARLLVACGDADWALVVTADDVGAVAKDLLPAGGLALPPDGAQAVAFGV